MQQRRWRLRSGNETAEAALCRELGLSPLLARLLVIRGIIEPQQAVPFLDSRLSEHLRSPMLFRDMRKAAQRLRRALADGEQIGVHGDYDVDGISGSAILIRFLRELGHEAVLHIPNRMRDGYGLTAPGVERLAAAGVKVLITVDCGAVSHAEITLANQLGMEVIVCDHHQVAATPLPAFAVLNPIEPSSGFPFQGLCGAGLAFYLAMGLRMIWREEGRTDLPDLRRYLDLVTLGTIADIVPMVEENRVLVKHGLRELAQTARPGIAALRAISGVTAVTAGTVGFRLAPRLNAGGRLAEATRSVELLTTDSPARAEELAKYLDEENRARQAIEQEILESALFAVESNPDHVNNRTIVLASKEWHAGVIGIVASRLVERFYRPTVLIALDAATGVGRGSGRSISGVNLHAVFAACAEHVIGFGGHHMAAGLSILDANTDAFAAAVENHVRHTAAAELFTPVTWADTQLPFESLGDPLWRDLGRLEPHGPGNPQALFFTPGVEVTTTRIVGTNHLKLQLREGRRTVAAIGFGMADRGVSCGDHLDVVYSVEENEWQGRRSLQLRLRDLRPARQDAPSA